MNCYVRSLCLAFVCWAFATVTSAQTTTATIFGVVRDSSGASVPQAPVVARNASTAFERTALTDETGSYLITNMPVGPYSLTIGREGFRRFIQDGITITVNENARVDAALSVG